MKKWLYCKGNFSVLCTKEISSNLSAESLNVLMRIYKDKNKGVSVTELRELFLLFVEHWITVSPNVAKNPERNLMTGNLFEENTDTLY